MAFKYKPAYTRVKSFDGKDVIIANKIDKPKKKQNSKPTIIGPDDRNWVERKLNTPKNTGFLGDVFDVLSRGQYASANVAKKLVDKKRDSAKDILKASIDGLKGKARTSYNDVLKETGMKKGWKRSTLGFVGDVVLDPTTYLTLGAGTVGKVGAKGAVKLSDKVAQKALVTQGGKDLAKKIATNGLTHQKNAKYVDKAISTAEKSMETSKNRTELAEHIADLKTMKNYLVNPQLKGSEKALVRLSLPFMKDKTLIKRGKLLDNVLSGVDDAVRKTKVGQVLGKGFIPNFRKGETDKLAHQQFTNSLKQLRTDKDNNQRQAVKEIIDRVGKGLAGTEREALARLFEHPEELKLAPARVKQAYTKVETLFPEIRKAEIDAGIYVPEKSNYLPHY
ncbi:MAG TPA: hypothetical protein VEA37_01215, partial [Flavobacterium sp.]|nr:hypothetical protein [Flavobacterium sp.]